MGAKNKNLFYGKTTDANFSKIMDIILWKVSEKIAHRIIEISMQIMFVVKLSRKVCPTTWFLYSRYYKNKKSTLLRYFETSFMHNIGGVFDRWWHDSLSMHYMDMRNSSYIVHETCEKNMREADFLVLYYKGVCITYTLYTSINVCLHSK